MQAGKKIVAGMLALALTIQGVPMQRGTAGAGSGPGPRKQHPCRERMEPSHGTDGTDAAAGMVSGG